MRDWLSDEKAPGRPQCSTVSGALIELSKAHLVLDLKPEGHQFAKLRETVMSGLSDGVQQHLLTAFWNYLLIIELTRQIVTYDGMVEYTDTRLRPAFEKLQQLYGTDDTSEQGDFSERLLTLVGEIAVRRKQMKHVQTTADVTQLVHSEKIRSLNEALAEYLEHK